MKQIFQFLSSETRTVSLQEKVLSAFLAFIATLLCIYVSSFFIDATKEPVYIASLGAAAVLVFAAPSSPFSQPWPLVGSHLICAFIGVVCFQFIPQFSLAAAFAVSFSIFFMYISKCLHPPGGAVALAIVLGGPEVGELGFQYVFSPVLINVVILLLLALLINNLVPGRTYPIKALVDSESKQRKLGVRTSLYNQDDLETALAEMDSYIDISRSDLHRIYRLAVSHANQRRIGNVNCGDIMTKEVLKFEYSTELEQAWTSLHEKRLKAAAVVDPFNRVIGIVTIRDFVSYADIKTHQEVYDRIKNFLKRTQGQTTDKLEVIGQIMTAPAVVMSQDQHIIKLLDVFADQSFHHMPIVDEKKYLVGMVTRSDLMSALTVLRN